MNKFRSIVTGFDFIVSIILLSILLITLPFKLNEDFLILVYGRMLYIVSIVFGLTFSGFSILMSSADDEFVVYLKEKNVYDDLIWIFKVCIYSLFTTLVLMFSHFIYLEMGTKVFNNVNNFLQSKFVFSIIMVFFSYSLLSTINSIRHLIKFSIYRGMFLKRRHDDNQN